MSGSIILIQPNCGKYDMFIRDMPLGLLYIARMLVQEGYQVHIVDQRVLGDDTHARLTELLKTEPLWIGITAMTGEPVHHALKLCRFLRERTSAPLVWGGIHPTVLSEVTIVHPLVDYVVRGKGEHSVLELSAALRDQRPLTKVPGLTWQDENGTVFSNPEDDDDSWGEMPMVPYELVNIDDYARVGFERRVFPIMTSRNCPHKCTFCYNSAIKQKLRWAPDSNDYTRRHIDYILKNYDPSYLSFIDDDFFVDRLRAREILEYVEKVKPPHIKVGFRGIRISDLRLLTDDDMDLIVRINTVHLNIGIESGSDRILKMLKKGMKAEHAVEVNRRFAQYPSLVPLYNFFSGVPEETEEDIRASTRLILQLTRENPNCQISGFHQYTPYPGNALFDEAVKHGFHVPSTLEEWGDQKFEENARNCPWIDKRRRALLEMIYCMIYFVDNKYDMYFANNNWYLKALQPLIGLYKPVARLRLRYHLTVFPVEIYAKDLFYKLFYRPSSS
ncbi:MAG: radical SAM protein [Phaeospirillum sp.]|nr:radical SAM protein [Phaeospirillum sp.]